MRVLRGGYKCYLYAVIFNEEGMEKVENREEQRASQEEPKRDFC